MLRICEGSIYYCLALLPNCFWYSYCNLCCPFYSNTGILIDQQVHQHVHPQLLILSAHVHGVCVFHLLHSNVMGPFERHCHCHYTHVTIHISVLTATKQLFSCTHDTPVYIFCNNWAELWGTAGICIVEAIFCHMSHAHVYLVSSDVLNFSVQENCTWTCSPWFIYLCNEIFLAFNPCLINRSKRILFPLMGKGTHESNHCQRLQQIKE